MTFPDSKKHLILSPKFKKWTWWNFSVYVIIEISYCLTIMENNFVKFLMCAEFNIDIIHIQWTLYYLFFIYVYLMTSRWCHRVLGKILYFDDSLFLKILKHPSDSKYASITSMTCMRETGFVFNMFKINLFTINWT